MNFGGDLGSDLQRLRTEIASAIDGISPDDLARHTEGKWSIAEILEHLYLSYTGTVKGFERCMEQGKPLARKLVFSDFIKIFVVTKLGYFPGGRKSPKQAAPRATPAEEFLPNLSSAIAKLDETISRCEERLGKNERLLDHPILGPLTGDEWRKFHLVHGRHHLRQIRRLRQEPLAAAGVEYGGE